jgi:RimJ/RimL family protein N-acetyltransferase
LSNELVGFCGFLVLTGVHSEPQLVYAMLQKFTGRGYATEMARASIAEARKQQGFNQVIASVDEENSASLRILEKLGFKRLQTLQGAFGNMFLLSLD